MSATEYNPIITVFIPVYNSERYLTKTLQSIIHQTFSDFEILIIDDGSLDNSVDLAYSINDNRIRIISNDKNMGLPYTRNRALVEAKGKYIAFIDSDDIAKSNRLEMQYHFLEQNPQIIGCGSHAIIISEKDEEIGKIKVFTDPKESKARLFFENTFVNSSMMIRTDVGKDYRFNENYRLAEDYDFWINISSKYILVNLDEYLVKYRIHDSNISRGTESKLQLVLHYSAAIHEANRRALGFIPGQDTDKIHYSIINRDYSKFSVSEYHDFLANAKRLNEQNHFYDILTFNNILFSYWFDIIYRKDGTSKPLSTFCSSPLFIFKLCTFKQLRKLFKKSLRNLIS